MSFALLWALLAAAAAGEDCPSCGVLDGSSLLAINRRSGTSVASAELATVTPHKYGKFEASIKHAAGDGVVSAFVLSTQSAETELGFKKFGSCKMQADLVDGPSSEREEHLVDTSRLDICNRFHTYGLEWTPSEVKYTVDGVEVHKITGSLLEQFNQNVGDGLGVHFQIWPGDETFGGTFDLGSLPVYTFIDWARYSAYAGDGFTQEWQAEFNDGSIPKGWQQGTGSSPAGRSTNRPENILVTGGYATLALSHSNDTVTSDSLPLEKYSRYGRGARGTPPSPASRSPRARGRSVGPAYASAELSSAGSYKQGKFEARIKWAGKDGVVSTFFLWKEGSERADTSWNELDFEKAGILGSGSCKMQLNFIGGMPGPEGNEFHVDLSEYNICDEFHTYGFEWTPEVAKFTIDGVELNKMTGSKLEQFNEDFGDGMEFHFNLWPGDIRFGGEFDPAILPVYQLIDWVRYSSYTGEGEGFTQEWQEDFNNDSLPEGWHTGDWVAPLGYAQHRRANVLVKGGYAILALTPSSRMPNAADIELPHSGMEPESECVPSPPSETLPPDAIASAELDDNRPNKYGKFEASIKYAAGDGVVSVFGLWKQGSERGDTFWNELGFKKIGASCNGTCKLQVAMLEGMPGPNRHEHLVDTSNLDVCNEFHTYGFEWTPNEVKFTIDGVEVHKITGSVVEQFNQNVGAGMGMNFQVWPGDEHFGGNFDPSSLPTYTYVDWVRFSSLQENGFRQEWQEDFYPGYVPDFWSKGFWWAQYAKHRPENIVYANGYAVLALTRAENVPTTDSVPLP